MERQKTWRIDSSGTLRLTTAPVPTVGEHEVLIRLRALSLNYRDLLILEDGDQTVPVSDGAGEVVDVGSAVRDFACGDRVMPSFFLDWVAGPYDPRYRASALGAATPGLASEYVSVPARSLVKIPEFLSYEEGATLPCAGVTAWNAMAGLEARRPNAWVLIQGTGGVSLFSLQLAAQRGFRPIVLTSSDEKAALARSLGAIEVVRYDLEPEWQDRVLEITQGRGVDRVVEVLGNANLTRSIKALATHGELAYIGCLAGFEGSFDPMALLYKNASLRGIYVGSRADLSDLAASLEEVQARPIVSDVFAFDSLSEALSSMRSKSHYGKVVVRVG